MKQVPRKLTLQGRPEKSRGREAGDDGGGTRGKPPMKGKKGLDGEKSEEGKGLRKIVRRGKERSSAQKEIRGKKGGGGDA